MKHTIFVSDGEPTLVVERRWTYVVVSAEGKPPFVILTSGEALALARVLTLEANR